MKGLFTEVWADLRKLIRGDEALRASYHPRLEGGKRAGCQELWLWELATHPTGAAVYGLGGEMQPWSKLQPGREGGVGSIP